MNGPTHNRRSFLQAGAAASSLLLSGLAVGAWRVSSSTSSGKIDLYRLVYTEDHPAAVTFGRAAVASGIPAQAIGRDVTSLWYDDLYHRWRQGPAAIAGMTPVRVAFCLLTLAQDVGMRLVFRAQHTPVASGGLEHQLSGPRSVLDRAGLLNRAVDWPLGAAQLVTGCRADFSAKSTAAVTSVSASGFAFREPLVSWVIAPPSRA